MSDFLAQITALQTQIESKNSLIASLIPQEAEWRTQSNVKCDQVLKAKRDACNADKQWKLSKANAIAAQIDNLRKEVVLLTSQQEAIREKQRAENTANVNLSTQGISQAALMIQAEGIAQATQTKAEAEAAAQAEVIRAQGAAAIKSTEASSKSQNTLMIVVVVAVLAAALALVAWKLKKSKSKSK